MNKIINTTNAPAAIGPYSQAILNGDMLFGSGQLGVDAATGVMPEGIEAQTVASLKNVDAILKEAGFTKENVIKTTVFIQNMNDFALINSIYAEYFGDHKPARSCVEVAKLPKGGLIEIEFIAKEA